MINNATKETTMNNKQLKKEILNKINKAKSIYVYQNFMECHFKSSKTELLWHFTRWYKGSNSPDNQNHLNDWLNEFNSSCVLNENNELFFG